jgi:hypothetical protein
MKRRKLTVFSLSFIDCICCGLGAIILLFVVVNSQNTAQRQRVTEELASETNRWELEVLAGRRDLVQARNTLDEITAELAKTEGLSRKILQAFSEKRLELADRDKQTLASREHVNKLKADLKSLEEDVKRLQAGAKRAEELGRNLRPFPGQGDRQYLTGLKMGGQRILILVDASASMLDETVVGVIRRRNMSSAEKLRAPKWRQAVATVDWLTANFPQDSRASRFFSWESCSRLAVRSRLRITVSPRISYISCSSRSMRAFRLTWAASICWGAENLESTNSRIIAPNPQQMQSRKERLNTSMSRSFFFTANPLPGT